MSNAKAKVLGNIRASLNRSGPLPARVTKGLNARLKRPTANIVPTVTGDPVACFVEKLKAVNAKVTQVSSVDVVSRTVSKHVKEHSLPHELVVAPDPALDGIRWSNRFMIERRAAIGGDRVSVTSAFAGIAETGTLMLLSSAQSPTTLNFLPEDHLIVLRAGRIVTHLEDAWQALRKQRGKMPRTVNLITGPSKTADVEQTIQEGAHGPRRLHVILVKS